MLVISRYAGERICLQVGDLTFTVEVAAVLEGHGSRPRVKIAVDAPRELVTVWREEATNAPALPAQSGSALRQQLIDAGTITEQQRQISGELLREIARNSGRDRRTV